MRLPHLVLCVLLLGTPLAASVGAADAVTTRPRAPRSVATGPVATSGDAASPHTGIRPHDMARLAALARRDDTNTRAGGDDIKLNADESVPVAWPDGSGDTAHRAFDITAAAAWNTAGTFLLGATMNRSRFTRSDYVVALLNVDWKINGYSNMGGDLALVFYKKKNGKVGANLYTWRNGDFHATGAHVRTTKTGRTIVAQVAERHLDFPEQGVLIRVVSERLDGNKFRIGDRAPAGKYVYLYRWQFPPTTNPGRTAPTSAAATPPVRVDDLAYWYDISTSCYDQLVPGGFVKVGFSPTIDFDLIGETTARFSPGETTYFYARAVFGPTGVENEYWSQLRANVVAGVGSGYIDLSNGLTAVIGGAGGGVGLGNFIPWDTANHQELAIPGNNYVQVQVYVWNPRINNWEYAWAQTDADSGGGGVVDRTFCYFP